MKGVGLNYHSISIMVCRAQSHQRAFKEKGKQDVGSRKEGTPVARRLVGSCVLVRKGIRSLLQFGVRTTWLRVRQKLHDTREARRLADHPLFTEAELQQQRQHVFPQNVLFSVVVPLYNTSEFFLRAMIDSVLAQTYANWELCLADGSDSDHAQVGSICEEYARRDGRVRYRHIGQNLGISGNTNECLRMAKGDFISLLDHDDVLHPAALHEVMRAICDLGADFVYTDENTFSEIPEDAYNPHFKPGFAPDTLRGNNYICHLTTFSRSLLDEAGGGFDGECDGAQDYDMILRLTEKAKRVAHIPQILYYWRAHAQSAALDAAAKPYASDSGKRALERHLQRVGLEGEVVPFEPGRTIYRIRYAIVGCPKVSIIVPNRDHLQDLQTCLESVFSKTTYPNYEIVIVENGSTSENLFDYYGKLQREHDNVQVINWSDAYDHSAINNYAAKSCDGDYLLLLNNDTEVISPDWIQEMLMFAQRGDVGAAGAKLYYPDGTIQHAGVGLGLCDLAAHYFCGVDGAHLGYMGRLVYAQDVSAVTGACMMVRRDVWDEVGGFDLGYPTDFNDIDLCMRIRKAGYLIVWTPHAELYHAESASRGPGAERLESKEFKASVLRFQKQWKHELEKGDPYFNPNFRLDSHVFAINPSMYHYDAR